MFFVCQGDNPRERALEMMMYGRLEANAEEELFKVCTGSVGVAHVGVDLITLFIFLFFWV